MQCTHIFQIYQFEPTKEFNFFICGKKIVFQTGLIKKIQTNYSHYNRLNHSI